MSTLLIVAMMFVLLSAVPRWRHGTRWGYGPSSILTLILVIAVVLAHFGRL